MVGESRRHPPRPCPPPGLAPLWRVRTTDFGDSRQMPREHEERPQEPARSPWNMCCGVEKKVRK